MEQKVIEFMKEIGFSDAFDAAQENRVKRWLNWYKGKTAEHSYYMYNGKSKKKYDLKSLNIIPQACGDLSDFFFNEKLDITIDKKDVDQKIHDVFKNNHFLERANKNMQLVKALGTGAIVPYLNKGVLKLNFFNATNIVILDTEDDEVSSVLFFAEKVVGDRKKLKINAHIKEDEGYIIYNRMYETKDNGKTWKKVELEEIEEIHTGSDIPQFAMLFTPEVNNEDINSPYGISCYARSLDTVLTIDRTYDTYDNEIWLGRKRVYIKGGAAKFNTDAEGNITPIFDPSDTAYYQVPGSENDPMIEESKFDLRIDQIKNALQGHLNLFTSQVGLGHNYYKFQDGQVYVNTDNVISSNSDVYRKIQKQENIITNAIVSLSNAIAFLLNIKSEFSVSVFYDDSVIEDTKETRLQAQAEFMNGLISKPQYYKDVYKLGDKEAKKFAKQMNEEILEFTIVDGSEPIE